MTLPTGFTPLFRTSPALDLIGPIYGSGSGADLVVGMLAAKKHCNARGTVHGGMLAMLADVALGYATAFSTESPAGLVTANLSINFIGSAQEGDWIEARTEIDKLGTRLAYANCHISANGRKIARASGVFAVSAPVA